VTVEWREPTPNIRGEGKYSQAAAELRANPGKWAVIKKCSSDSVARNIAHAIRRRGLKAFKSGGFEAVARGVEVFARFVGEVTP
jgi:hypothetical protein